MSGFDLQVNETRILLGHYATCSVNFLLNFRTFYLYHLQGSRILLVLKNETITLSRNFGKELQLHAA